MPTSARYSQGASDRDRLRLPSRRRAGTSAEELYQLLTRVQTYDFDIGLDDKIRFSSDDLMRRAPVSRVQGEG